MEVNEIVERVLERLQMTNQVSERSDRIPTGISNRHLHLSEAAAAALFGVGYTFTKLKDLSQPGQYACNETVTLVGPRGVIEKVRILGPVRKETQVELLLGDCRKLGIKAVLRESGKLEGTPGLTLCGPKGCHGVTAGAIVAKRHIHMTPADAAYYGCQDGEAVTVLCEGERGGSLHDVTVRVSSQGRLEFHVDFDEANAMGMQEGDSITICGKGR